MNEKHHAFISATFYQELKQTCPDRAAAIFAFATQKYGEQRGGRMAQKALRDGKPLTYSTYAAYGEVNYTEECYLSGQHVQVLAESPNHEYTISQCPWEEQYAAMGQREGAMHYCSNIDLAVLRGFNPFLKLDVKSTIHTAGKCHFVYQEVDAAKAIEAEDNSQPFEYHCGHLFRTFAELVEAILGPAGKAVGDRVVARVRESFGEAIAQRVLSYRDTRFDLLGPRA